jgi:hypothetical protein
MTKTTREIEKLKNLNVMYFAIIISEILFFTLFIVIQIRFYSQTYNKFANSSDYVEAFLNTDRGICMIRFPAECPTTALICESDMEKVKEKESITSTANLLNSKFNNYTITNYSGETK